MSLYIIIISFLQVDSTLFLQATGNLDYYIDKHLGNCLIAWGIFNILPLELSKLVQYSTVEPWFNNLRYNDISGITINIRLPAKVIVKCKEQKHSITIISITIFRFNDGNVTD